MRRNFIDTDALNTAIVEELANLVPLLIPTGSLSKMSCAATCR